MKTITIGKRTMKYARRYISRGWKFSELISRVVLPKNMNKIDKKQREIISWVMFHAKWREGKEWKINLKKGGDN